ncbi:TPA: hypothetical protein QCY71_005774 [Bacillus cereus]|nr:hypothetical protein [Bacillus cereus]
MRLFIREHVPLISFSIIQLLLVLLVYWIDGYNHLLTALYSIFLGVCFLLGYLVYRYYSHRKFYESLSNPPKSLNKSLPDAGGTPHPST